MSVFKNPCLTFFGLFALLATVTLYAAAQEPEEERPTPRRRTFQMGPRIVSPEIHSDNTVTFRLLAPKATRVTISGEWMPGFGQSN